MENKNLIIEKLNKLIAKFSVVSEETPIVEENVQEVEIKLEEAKLQDGTVVKWNAETMEAVLVLVDAEGNESETPITVGEYVLEDGKIIVVEVEGIVKEIKEPEMVEEVAPIEEEMSAKIQTLEEIITNLSAEIETLKNDKVGLESKVIELSKEPAAKPINMNPNFSKFESDLNPVQKRLLGIK
jgi:hypothetical protein